MNTWSAVAISRSSSKPSLGSPTEFMSRFVALRGVVGPTGAVGPV
ncbi:MAG: hypothetical protein ACP5E5_13510 [Acidobacteriaceae bacterium]